MVQFGTDSQVEIQVRCTSEAKYYFVLWGDAVVSAHGVVRLLQWWSTHGADDSRLERQCHCATVFGG